jgi:hypothetical protein
MFAHRECAFQSLREFSCSNEKMQHNNFPLQCQDESFIQRFSKTLFLLIIIFQHLFPQFCSLMKPVGVSCCRFSCPRLINSFGKMVVILHVKTILPEFIAKAIRRWLPHAGVETLYVEPGSPWENG